MAGYAKRGSYTPRAFSALFVVLVSVLLGTLAFIFPVQRAFADEVDDSCTHVEQEGRSLRLSRWVYPGDSLTVSGQGWNNLSELAEAAQNFVVISLDGGKERRAKTTVLPAWVPANVNRNVQIWDVTEVDLEGNFTGVIRIPASWADGSTHTISVGDGASGIAIDATVEVVFSPTMVATCTFATIEPTNPITPNPNDNPTPLDDLLPTPSTDIHTRADVNVHGEVGQTYASAPGSRGIAGEDLAEQNSSSPSFNTGTARGVAPSSAQTASAGASSGGAASDSPQAEQSIAGTGEAEETVPPQSVDASQIGPRTNADSADAASSSEVSGRLNAWLLLGGGAVVLLGAGITVAAIYSPHLLWHSKNG